MKMGFAIVVASGRIRQENHRRFEPFRFVNIHDPHTAARLRHDVAAIGFGIVNDVLKIANDIGC